MFRRKALVSRHCQDLLVDNEKDIPDERVTDGRNMDWYICLDGIIESFGIDEPEVEFKEYEEVEVCFSEYLPHLQRECEWVACVEWYFDSALVKVTPIDDGPERHSIEMVYSRFLQDVKDNSDIVSRDVYVGIRR